jgi:site-specific DNA-methyltransferase (adenine-specific)
MKPLSEKSFVDQALKNGRGVTWLDDCRVPTAEGNYFETNGERSVAEGAVHFLGDASVKRGGGQLAGRFPANLLVSDQAVNDNEYARFFSLDEWADRLPDRVKQCFPFLIVPKASKQEKNAGLEDFDEKKKWLKGGTGTGISARENVTCKNVHPTVKPLQLMCYLITLGSRRGDVVLDPFLGSGTTALAAKLLNRRYVGIEKEADYVEIAEARLQGVTPFY